MGKLSPTSRTMRALREAGQYAEIVETFNHVTNRRKDLLGFIDVITFRDGLAVGIQVTGGGNGPARKRKVLEERRSQSLQWLCAGCLIEIHDWRKVSAKRGGKRRVWRCRVIPITLADYVDHKGLFDG